MTQEKPLSLIVPTNIQIMCNFGLVKLENILLLTKFKLGKYPRPLSIVSKNLNPPTEIT